MTIITGVIAILKFCVGLNAVHSHAYPFSFLLGNASPRAQDVLLSRGSIILIEKNILWKIYEKAWFIFTWVRLKNSSDDTGRV